MKILMLIILAALFLVGCTTTEREVVQVAKPVRVEIPVMVPCKAVPPAVPVWETSRLTKDTPDFEKIRALLIERRQRETYEATLLETFGPCTTD